MPDRRFQIALGVSLAAHLALMAMPGWQPPRAADELSRVIEARLALRSPAPAVAAPPPAAVPPPPRARPLKPVPEPWSGARADSADRGRTQASTPPNETGPAAAPPKPPAPQPEAAPMLAEPSVASTLPPVGRIRFSIATGNGFEIGQATHAWVLEADRYVLRATLETTGLAALFRAVEVRQVSSGRMTPKGLQPLEFSSSRGDKATEQVRFDWEHRQLFMSGGGRRGEQPLAPGSQDVLSVFYQAVMFPPQDSSAWMVATGKGYEKRVFERVGDERLESRLGPLATLHLRLGGQSDRIDLWLSTDHAFLPVRIRYVDRKGEVNQQDAVEIEYPGVSLKPPAPPPKPPSY